MSDSSASPSSSTPRERSEQALLEQKHDIAALLDALPGLVAILTPAGEIDAVNNELAAYCGQPLDALRQWGTNGIVHSDDLPHVAAIFGRSMSTGEPYDFEARILRFDGVYRWNQVRGLPFRDSSGRIVRWYVLLSDIDNSKRAEEALRLSEERYALAMRASGEGHWDWKIATDEFYASPRYLELAGLPPDMNYSRRDDIVPLLPFHPDDRSRYEAAVAAHFAGETPRLDMVIRLVPNGVVRWLHVIGMCSRDADGRPLRWAGSVSDITERKLAEHALRNSEQRYERAMLAAQAGFWDWDVPNDEFYVSPRLVEMSGFPPGTTFTGREDFLRRSPLHPDDLAKWLRAVDDLFAGGGSRVSMEVRSNLNGETVWRRLEGMCFRNESGRVVRWTGSATDVSARKRAEVALREQTERLQLGQAAMRMIIMDWNVTEDVLTWSDSPEWLRGPLPPTGSYPAFKDQVHPEDRDRFLATRRRALETLEVQTTEFRLVRTDGEVIWVLERKHAFADADSTSVRMLAAMFDITDRKRVEGALRESQERYALAVAGSNDGIWDWDLVTNKMFVSERAQGIFGLETGPTERLREEWHAMIDFHPVDHQAQRRMVEEYLSGRRSSNEGDWRVRGKDGAYRWIRIRSICLRNAAGEPIRMAGSVSDIDAQKKAEEALRSSEERYALAVDGASQGIFDWDLSNDLVFHSRRAQEFFGLEAGQSLRPRQEWAAMIRYHPEDRPHMLASIRRHLNGETPTCDIEYRVLPKPGEVRWLHLRGVVLRDASGKAYRMAGSIQDVTERKVAAEALRQSESRFRALVELNASGFWEQDENLRYTPSAYPYNVAGYPTANRVGKTRWEIEGALTPLSSSWTEHQADLAAHRSFRNFEYRRIRSDGKIGYYSVSGVPIFDEGRFKGYYGVVGDITERKRVEEELRSRQEMLEVAQTAARAIAFEWRVKGGEGENRWSPELEAMYGIPAGSYDGTYESWKKLIYPEDWPKVQTAIKVAQQTGDVDAEYRVLHAGGKIRWLQAKGRMFFDPQGAPTRIVGFMLDVTDRHLAQEELQRMERQLRQAQRLEALGTLAGGIAHDFNNLLGAILGYGEMALRNVRAGTRLRRDIESIMIAGERGHALVERILAFSRSGIGERVAVHVEKIARETLALFAAKVPRHISIEQRLHSGSAAVMGDPTQIHQVLMNLLTNAVQAMPSGGTLRVTIDRVNAEAARVVTMGAITPREYVLIDVSDSGTGIPVEILEKIFDPFFTTKEVGVGTGLGLSLVHGIVTGLDGAIDVGTTVGTGSTFKVYLPLTHDIAVTSEPAKQPKRTPRRKGRGRIMVIDDEEALVRLATATLAESGYSAAGFTSSMKAIEAFIATPDGFDAVITDESMPGASGSELIPRMRALRPTMPILLVSGYLTAQVVERARRAGATEVLKKPLPARQLQAALARVLQAARTPSPSGATSSKPSTGPGRRRRVAPPAS